MMNGNSVSGELIPEDELRHRAERYLLQRYHEFDKVKFDSCELYGSGSGRFYRFTGKVILKSKGTLDRFVSEKTAGFYTFIFDINAVGGQIINYVFN